MTVLGAAGYLAESVDGWARVGVHSCRDSASWDAFVKGADTLNRSVFLLGSVCGFIVVSLVRCAGSEHLLWG